MCSRCTPVICLLAHRYCRTHKTIQPYYTLKCPMGHTSFGSIQIDPMFSWSYRLYLDCLFHGRKVVRPISTGYIYPLNIIQIALSKHRGTERIPRIKLIRWKRVLRTLDNRAQSSIMITREIHLFLQQSFPTQFFSWTTTSARSTPRPTTG